MHEPSDTISPARDTAAVVFSLVFPSIVTLVYFVWLASAPASVQQTSYSIGKIIQFGFPVVWVVWFQQRRMNVTTPRATGVLLGMAFGLVVAAAMLTLYHLHLKPEGYFVGPAETVRDKVKGFGVDNALKYLLLGLFYSICHSFLEEYYWRWFVFAQLRRLAPLGWAITLSSIGFMAHHVIVLGIYFGWSSPATWLFSISVAVGGAVWAWLYDRSHSLAGPWLSHLIVDAGIFVVGYDMVRSSLG